MASFNRFKDTTVYGNLINDNSGVYIANTILKGNLAVYGEISCNGNLIASKNLTLGNNAYSSVSNNTIPLLTATLNLTEVSNAYVYPGIPNTYSGYFLKLTYSSSRDIQELRNLYEASTATSAFIKIWNSGTSSYVGSFTFRVFCASTFTGLGNGTSMLIIPQNYIATLKAVNNTWQVLELFNNTDANPLVNLGFVNTTTTTNYPTTLTSMNGNVNFSGRILYPYKKVYTSETITSDYSG